MNDLPRFCRDCAWCSPPWPGTMGCPPEWPFCRAPQAAPLRDLVSGAWPMCAAMRYPGLGSGTCDREAAWFKPKEAPDAPVH